eukprot:612053-Amphidinium_carterae.1
MGWSWGLHVVQMAHLELLKSRIPQSLFAHDFAPPPLSRVKGGTAAVILYVDNVVVVGTQKSEVQSLASQARKALIGA